MASATKILVVEDEPSILRLYETKLHMEGFDVRGAVNGEDGLAQAQAFVPDVILLDLRMPVMSGDEMLMKLRAEEWGAGIQVIILTNISRSEAPSSLRFLGVDRYIVKAHYTPAQVVEIVREVLDMRSKKS